MSAVVVNPTNLTSVFIKPVNSFTKNNEFKKNLNNFLLTAHSEISQVPDYELNDESTIETLTASIQSALDGANPLSRNPQSIQKTVAFSAAYTMQQALFNGEVNIDKAQYVIAESNKLYLTITEQKINSSTDLACAINHTLNQVFLNTRQLSFETKQSMAQTNTKQIAELLTNHHTGNSKLNEAQVTVLTSNMCYHFEHNHACTPEQAKQFAQQFMAGGFKDVNAFLQSMIEPQDDVAPQQGLQSLPLASHVLDSLGGQEELKEPPLQRDLISFDEAPPVSEGGNPINYPNFFLPADSPTSDLISFDDEVPSVYANSVAADSPQHTNSLQPLQNDISQGFSNSNPELTLPKSRKVMEQQALRKAELEQAKRKKEEADAYKASLEQAKQERESAPLAFKA